MNFMNFMNLTNFWYPLGHVESMNKYYLLNLIEVGNF